MAKVTAIMTSGGLDSTVLAYWAMQRDYHLLPVFLDYGQHCAETEKETLQNVLPSELLSRLAVIDVSGIFSASSSRLINAPNLWEDDVTSDDLMLPYRNLFLLTAGAAFAASRGAETLLTAFINSNHAYEIDASRTFLQGVDALIGSIGSVKLEMPFRTMSKAEVAKIGMTLGAPIFQTYSCQIHSTEHCGSCPNCVERLAAIAELA